jgi:hypothetical protein
MLRMACERRAGYAKVKRQPTKPVADLDKTMNTVPRDTLTAATQAKKAKLESLGYCTSHLSSLEIDELLKRVEPDRPATDWRSKL